MGFVRKVYGILSAQLLLTAVIAAPISTMDNAWLGQHSWLLFASVAMTLATVIVMACCQDVARRFPGNYICLVVFTAFEGVLVGFVSARYTWQSVVLAASVTFLVFAAMTAYAWRTKHDFTGLGPYLFGALAGLFCFGLVISIMSLFGAGITWPLMFYDAIGVIIFTFYIVYDTQLVIGGSHKVQFSVDDYVFASLHLYLDIINLFLHLLSLFGNREQ